ncbi:hypothetical protein J1614_007465 [Plenodomus biglobosus]|nr:hypothetical protein J1614_007465 [Plenodomus biglobosus]
MLLIASEYNQGVASITYQCTAGLHQLCVGMSLIMKRFQQPGLSTLEPLEATCIPRPSGTSREVPGIRIAIVIPDDFPKIFSPEVRYIALSTQQPQVAEQACKWQLYTSLELLQSLAENS